MPSKFCSALAFVLVALAAIAAVDSAASQDLIEYALMGGFVYP
jgi:hypothetical protein